MGQTFREMGWEDRTVKVNRLDMLKKLKENRDKHIQDYKDACDGYREAAVRKIDHAFNELRGQVERLKKGELVRIYASLDIPVPESYERAYNQIIEMMEWCVDEHVELTSSQFGCFVMDDWDWKRSWTTSNAGYIGMSKRVK